jgi:hypothetical protein
MGALRDSMVFIEDLTDSLEFFGMSVIDRDWHETKLFSAVVTHRGLLLFRCYRRLTVVFGKTRLACLASEVKTTMLQNCRFILN